MATSFDAPDGRTATRPVDEIIDGADAKPALDNPRGPNAIARHGLDDARGLLPVKLKPGAATACEKVHVAAAEEIVAQVELGMAQTLEGLAGG